MSTSQGDDGDGEVMTLRWVFVRGHDQIEVRRPVAPSSTQIEVSGAGSDLRAFTFVDHACLVAFHAGFEQALAQTGWTLAEFHPERRSGVERRGIPRDTDRRRSIALVWSR